MLKNFDKAAESGKLSLPDSDLDFVVSTVAPEFKDKERLKRLIREDKSFRKGLIGNERLFRRLMSDKELMLKISPSLLFEILLRRTLINLERASYIMESAGPENIPIFHSKQAASFLANEFILDYLASMLSSFTRTESFVIPFRVRKGIWRRIRFSDMDTDSLVKFCELLDEGNRFPFYKRMADLCLFIPGMFPQYANFDYRYPSSGKVRPRIVGRLRRSAEDYEEGGKIFYKLAMGHKKAKVLDLEEPLYELCENFNLANGCLNFISEHYLKFRRGKLFNLGNA